ncbi:F0F1 ATP synthase subunit B [Syntrophaceticus schinkii]|uniref:ATP synthase subunit b n=1 Tax=Syntrophaceticus schinkii TaxID=499207 RepID=A0A0B7ML54_9FIRM|nr:F0F1 ATP synthase subunit B [Syntrophaceticus schinkii]MDD2358883.1 F0F1 ATP synthase subunit B [Syntrophaceticus schinkii]MDD4260953.1 F0F1 ATP synthase subunit B [Syntrophaceticus schinkii]MDD4674071.1 F0F1 ATP synthase subunit B [Syntrophaceticus schinkii]CEO88686.1 ATP synthase subunit b [Syntrophaceticus schinkii]
MTLNLTTAIWAIINFLVILALLYKFAFNPVMSFLDNRSKEIADNISEAERGRDEADKLLREYKEQIAGAREEAQEIIDRAAKAGEEQRAAILAQTRNESAVLLERARQEIQREKEQALHGLRQEVSTLAVMAAERILIRNIDTEDNKRIVDDFLSEVGEIH